MSPQADNYDGEVPAKIQTASSGEQFHTLYGVIFKIQHRRTTLLTS